MEQSMEVKAGRYLSGEADETERRNFESELEANAQLKAWFETYQIIWDQAPAVTTSDWDSDNAWTRFTSRNVPVVQPKPVRRLRWAIAAAVVLAIGAAALLWSGPSATLYAYDADQSGPVLLPDNSKVYLNKDAILRVYSFQKKIRRVELQGEAFFEVTHDDSKPFTVTAGNTITEVVGTAFNIHQSPERTTIFVKEGKVIFSENKSREILALAAGEAASFESGEIHRIVNPSPNVHAWHTRQLSFNGMPLSAIITDMVNYFETPIRIDNDQIKDCRLNSTKAFQDPRFEDVIDVVVASLNAEMVMEGKTCIIKGGRCP